jgi:hypothetical protein
LLLRWFSYSLQTAAFFSFPVSHVFLCTRSPFCTFDSLCLSTASTR